MILLGSVAAKEIIIWKSLYTSSFSYCQASTLSIGVEQYEKEELLYNLRIVMNQVMAEKYIEFKMLNAPEMLQ
jgi:hypothetical protein